LIGLAGSDQLVMRMGVWIQRTLRFGQGSSGQVMWDMFGLGWSDFDEID